MKFLPKSPCVLTAAALLVLSLVVSGAASGAVSDWSQWGGPNGNFSTEQDPGLSTNWGEGGPKVLWRLSLGDHGHSAIVVLGSTAYTTYRRGGEDVLVAADISSGARLWEKAYDAPVPENHDHAFGPGPHSTPLVMDGRVITSSAGSSVKAFDAGTGEALWQRDLRKEEEVAFMFRGYGASPIAWGDLVILNGGGNGQGVIALNSGSGDTVWKAVDGPGSYSSPVIMTLGGVEQLVVAFGSTRAGLNKQGEVLWSLDLPETASSTMATQVQVGPNQVFTSSAYADGTRLYEVTQTGGDSGGESDGGWHAEEKWYTRKMRIQHGVIAALGGNAYGSSGDFGPAFLAGVDLATGKLLFRQRGFAKSNVIRVGDKVLILDEDGTLALGAPSSTGIEILTQSSVLDRVTWTPPTLVGTTLLVRNRDEMLALDLSTGPGEMRTTSRSDSGPGEAVVAFERSRGGLSIQVPGELLDRGETYYLTPGEDAQIIVQSKALLQRTALVSERVVGAMVTPLDFGTPGAVEKPVLAGSFRFPVHSLRGGSTRLRQLLFGPQGINQAEHPEVVVHFLSASDSRIVAEGESSTTLELTAKVKVEANGQELELEAPMELTFEGATMESMTRNVGDLAVIRSTVELDMGQLGVAVPAQLAVVLNTKVTVDLYLGFSTVSPDKVPAPFMSQEHFDEENRYLVLARDFGEDVKADAHLRRLMKNSWDDPDRLAQLALLTVAEPGIERRNLGLALEAAVRANELEQGQNALLLNTLARIQYQRGEVEQAVATQTRALELVDAQSPAARAGLEANLARYQAGLP